MGRDQHGHPRSKLFGERVFDATAGRAVALIPLAADCVPCGCMIRSGGQASSIVRIFQAELLNDPDSDTVAPIEVMR